MKIDDVKVLRQFASGGFGSVFLAKAGMGEYFALKKIKIGADNRYKKELKSLELYSKLSTEKFSINIVPILDYKISDEEIMYLMPLADGEREIPPEDERWKPMTLTEIMAKRYGSNGYFNPDEFFEIFDPIFKAIIFLHKNKLLHRDIKPDNILFFGGKAYLADLGLIREDTSTASTAGTPIFSPPTWYSDTKGDADMWGLATTMYSFLTGNDPDKIWHLEYRYPPQKVKMSQKDILAYAHFSKIIMCATREKPIERFKSISDFYDKLKNFSWNFGDKNSPELRTSSSIFSFSGRLNRTIFFAYFGILNILCEIILGILSLVDDPYIVTPVIAIVSPASYYLMLTVLAKRMHDAGKSAWFSSLTYFIFIFVRDVNLFTINNIGIGIALLAVFTAFFISLKSERGPNEYGLPNQKLRIF